MNKAASTAVKERFDQAAADWDNNPGRVALAKGVAAAISDTVPLSPDMEAMDFGAGTGLLTLSLLPQVKSITAVDASAEMLKVLDGKVKSAGITNVKTRYCDLGGEQLPEAAYTLVVSSMVLHHIVDVPWLFKLLRRCLRPGGWIALADLDTEDGSFHADPAGVFHHGFDRAEVCRWLGEAGFTEVNAREAHGMTKQDAQGKTRSYTIFLVSGRVA